MYKFAHDKKTHLLKFIILLQINIIIFFDKKSILSFETYLIELNIQIVF